MSFLRHVVVVFAVFVVVSGHEKFHATCLISVVEVIAIVEKRVALLVTCSNMSTYAEIYTRAAVAVDCPIRRFFYNTYYVAGI